MADRTPQYQMPNFNNNLLQQQLQQLQPQQHQDQHPNMSNQVLDQTRAWQMQMQQQQYRPNAAQDMNHHNQAQIADLMKRQQAVRQQHLAQQLQHQQQQQQQQQHPQQQQPFLNAGMAQMGGGPVMGGNGQQPFHDAASGHPQQNHMQGGFQNTGGMPNGNMNPAAAAALQARNPFLPHARQLELINMAQNQQPQNGPVNLNKFNNPQLQQQQQQQHAQMQQQQQQSQPQQFPLGMNQPSPGDVFSSPGMANESLRRPSPHNNLQQPPGMPQGAPPPPPGNLPPGPGVSNGRPMLPASDLQGRLAAMRPLLLQQEAVIQNLNQRLNAIRGTDPPEEAKLMERIKESTAEYAKRKEYATRIMMGLQYHQKLVAQSQAQQMNGNGGNGGPGQSQSSWAPHPGQGFAEGPSGQPSRAQMGQMAGQPPHSLQANPMQSSPSLQQAQSQGGHPANQPIVPPRSIPTPQQSGPQQLPGSSPFSGMPPSSMSGSIPFPNSNPQAQPIAGPSQPTMTGGNPMQNTFGIMPLDKHKFDPMFRTFCNRRNVKPDNRLLSIENRPVDLHALHVQVMQEGGINKVEASEVWPIIGGRLGFIQFPGDENTPAKSGPGVATQLGHIYKEYIAPFDQWYIIEAKRAQMAASGDITARMQSNRWTPAQMQAVVSMSQMSVAELHAQHIDEKMIQFVEANRASLQRTFQEQRSFQTRVRSSSQAPGGPQGAEPNGGPGPRPPGMGLNPGFPAGSPAQNGPSMMAARQHMLNQQMAQQQQQQHQQQQQPGQQLMGGPHGLPVTRMPQQGGLVARGSMNAALPIIQKMKQDFMANNFNNLPSVEIPPEQLHEYNRILEQVHRQCTEADQRIAMMLGVLRNEEGVRKMVQIVCTVQQQRILLSTTNSPRYIVSLDNLRMMSADLQRIVESSNHQFQQVMRNNPQMFTSNAMMQQQQQQAQQLAQQQQQQQRQQQHQQQPQQQPPQQQQQQMPGNVMVPPNPIMGTPDMSHHNRTAVPHRPPSVVASSPPTTQPLRPPVALPHPPPIKRKPQASNGPVSTPSPAPVQSVSTPVASAPTPTAIASSPPNSTKSPKTKAAPKPKGGAKRRPSKAIPPPAPPAPELSQPTTSSSSGSVKRQREEEPVASGSSATNGSSAAAAASEPSPPKRVKTEWEAQPSEEQRKKEEAIENIKTEPDAQAFFEQMTELFKRSVEDNPQESPSNGFDALDQIFKVVYPGSDSMEMLGEPSGHREPSPPPMMNESFDEFFDFSFGTVEDEDTKAPTPDLVSSSSTNPSPESNHEAEGAHHVPASSSSSTTDIKTEELNDMLRLGPWKEIDGGEATYYQTSDWKWDSPMTSTDPWAIFNS